MCENVSEACANSFQWEDQHRGISCNDFTRWKAENDEGNQQKGLAAFLKENGIGEAIHVLLLRGLCVFTAKFVESWQGDAAYRPSFCYRVSQVPLPL